jgi:hypothetical protein
MESTASRTATTPETALLARIENELTAISEQQHSLARQVAILRKARTLLHVGCSALTVNATIVEQIRKEAPQRAWSASGYDAELGAILMGRAEWRPASAAAAPGRDDLEGNVVPMRASRG